MAAALGPETLWRCQDSWPPLLRSTEGAAAALPAMLGRGPCRSGNDGAISEVRYKFSLSLPLFLSSLLIAGWIQRPQNRYSSFQALGSKTGGTHAIKVDRICSLLCALFQTSGFWSVHDSI
jgi:hypothetical protein